MDPLVQLGWNAPLLNQKWVGERPYGSTAHTVL